MNIFISEEWQNGVLAPVLYRDRFENWKKEAAKIPGNDSGPKQDYLGTSAYKTLIKRGNENIPSATIGGMCVVYSGDLKYLMQGALPDGSKITEVKDIAQWSESLPRLDQILDSIGPTASNTYACVFEDSFFARLIADQLELNREELTKIFRSVSERSSEIIRKWLSIATGGTVDFTPIYTSDIDEALQECVTKLAGEAGNPDILKNEKSKINMMYTYLWPALLKKEGYLPDESVLCCEPFQHFLEVALPTRDGYYGIDKFLADNPWGAGKNSKFQAAGFIPAIGLNGQTFSRQEPYTEAANQSNAEKMLTTGTQKGLSQPFPINQNPIVKESVNLLYPFEGSRQVVKSIIDIEKEYKMKKKGSGSKEDAARIKSEFEETAVVPLEEISRDLREICKKLGFVR